MRKSLIKIVSLLLIIGLNWTGLLAVGNTFAYYNDTETSSENSYSAGTLDFQLSPQSDFYNLTLGEENQIAKREIEIQNQGTLGFWYKITTTSFSKKCQKLNLTLILEDGTEITQPLKDFQTGPIQFSDLTDDLEFVVSPAKNISGKKTCDFTLQFEAWQDETFGVGFWDIEEIPNTVTIEREKNKKAKDDIVINEFLPNPSGDDCILEGLEGEWVEIYNRGSTEVDLEDWYLLDSEDNKIVISEYNTHTGFTIIEPKDSGNEWLVVFLNGCILNNEKGDTISLYDDEGSLIDSYTYKGSVPENKSFARYPDGSKKWYDPIPTPGGPNILEEEIFEEETTEEEPTIEETSTSNEETATTTEETATTTEEITPTEEATSTDETTINEEPPVIETIDETINEIPDETGGETTEDVIEEPASESNTPAPEESSANEEVPADETPAVEEQPVVAPDDSSSTPDGAGENVGDGGSGDGGGEIGVSSDGSSPAEGAGESL
jgi:predicted ribosomally synthesized peptide with SipW-like signal peptide